MDAESGFPDQGPPFLSPIGSSLESPSNSYGGFIYSNGAGSELTTSDWDWIIDPNIRYTVPEGTVNLSSERISGVTSGVCTSEDQPHALHGIYGPSTSIFSSIDGAVAGLQSIPAREYMRAVFRRIHAHLRASQTPSTLRPFLSSQLNG